MPIVKTKPTSAGRRHVVKLLVNRVVVTILVASLPVTLVVDIKNTTVSLTLSGPKMVSRRLSSAWNTILTALRTLR